MVSLGNRQSGAILGVEAALSRDGESHFTYVALSEVRVLSCQTAALTRRCTTKEFTSLLQEYAEACLGPAAVARMVLVETEWIKTRNEHHLAATGLQPMPLPPLADDTTNTGALRMASVQSLAKLAPQIRGAMTMSMPTMTPTVSTVEGGHRVSAGGLASSVRSSDGGGTPRLPQIGSRTSGSSAHRRLHRQDSRSDDSGREQVKEVVSMASRALLHEIDDAEDQMTNTDQAHSRRVPAALKGFQLTD